MTGSCGESSSYKWGAESGCTAADGTCAYKIKVDAGRRIDAVQDTCPYDSNTKQTCHCFDTVACSPNCFSRCTTSGCGKDDVSIYTSDADCMANCKKQGYTEGNCFVYDASKTTAHSDYNGKCYYATKSYYCQAGLAEPTGDKIGCNCPTGGSNPNCLCEMVQDCPDGNDFTDAGNKKCDAVTGCRKTGPSPTPSPTPSPSPSPTEGTGGSSAVIDLIKTAVYKIVMTLYCLVLYIASAVAALFIILTGIKYMSSDEEGGRAESRKRMVYALAGLMVVVLACPLVNLLFAGTNIGIPNASGGKDACPGCPIIGQMSSTGGGLGGWTGGYGGGGDTSGSWFTPDRIKQAESFQECSASKTCPTGKVCATTAGTYRCYPKIADGYSISESGLTPLPPGTDVDLCNSGYALGDKCVRNPICSNAAGCKDASSNYCNKNSLCTPKLGLDATCISDMIKGDDPDAICTSKWCISGHCSAKDTCTSSDDCDRHYTGGGRYCDKNNGGECKTKLTKGRCDSKEINNEDNRVCSTGKCEIPAGSSQTSKECI